MRTSSVARLHTCIAGCITVAFTILLSLITPADKATAQTFGIMPDARHQFIIRADGVLMGFGQGSYGKIGVNNTNNYDTVILVQKGDYPGTSYFGDVSTNSVVNAGGDAWHSIAVTADGVVYAWGDNTGGQLGQNNVTNGSTYYVPRKVRKGQYGGTTYLGDATTDKIIAVRGGSSSSAGVSYSMALAQSGLVYTWGYNAAGQLGDNTNTNRSTPVKVRAGRYGSGRTYLGDMSTNKIIAISAGEDGFAMALANDGTVYSWGYGGVGSCNGTEGRLGVGNNTSYSTPRRVLKGQYPGTTYLGDLTTNKVVSISTGGQTTMTMMQDGSIYTWGGGCLGSGNSGVGKLGNSTQNSYSTPIRLWKGDYPGTTYMGDVTTNKIKLMVNGGRTIGVVASDNSVYTWGENFSGQVGDGTATTRSTPVRVLMGLYPGTTYLGDNPSDTIVLRATAERSTYFITQSGKVYSVGNDFDSELGDCAVHSPTYMSTPVRVKGNYANAPCSDLILPITLTSFEAVYKGKNIVQLVWHTASEINSYAFEVERRTAPASFDDEQPWERVGVVGGHGTTSLPNDYTMEDDVSMLTLNGPKMLQYRLRSVDLTGEFMYTDPRSVRVMAVESEAGLQLIPEGEEYIARYTLPEPMRVLLQVFTAEGKLVYTYTDQERQAGVYQEWIDAGEFQSGQYFCRLIAGTTIISKTFQNTR